jgi:Uma2 family endonuclease
MLNRMSSEAKRRATYQDVLDAPDNVVAEVIDGELYTHARPRVGHARVASNLGADISDAFGRGRSGPGGWVVVVEPELHLGDEPDIVVPDIAAWRKDRFPDIGPDAAFVTVAPDWLAEVLSPSTARVDRALKLPLYARQGVSWVWLLDPAIEVLEVYRLEDHEWRLQGTFAGNAPIQAQPFDAVELDSDWLWARERG